jgi:hypothetical protein
MSSSDVAIHAWPEVKTAESFLYVYFFVSFSSLKTNLPNNKNTIPKNISLFNSRGVSLLLFSPTQIAFLPQLFGKKIRRFFPAIGDRGGENF